MELATVFIHAHLVKPVTLCTTLLQLLSASKVHTTSAAWQRPQVANSRAYGSRLTVAVSSLRVSLVTAGVLRWQSHGHWSLRRYYLRHPRAHAASSPSSDEQVRPYLYNQSLTKPHAAPGSLTCNCAAHARALKVVRSCEPTRFTSHDPEVSYAQVQLTAAIMLT